MKLNLSLKLKKGIKNSKKQISKINNDQIFFKFVILLIKFRKY